MESRSDELYHVLCEKGYPDDFCKEIAYRQMNTDYTATRMLGYLYRVSDPRPEDVVDEMLAILIDREAIIKKKELEHAQATINHVYREGLRKYENIEQFKAEQMTDREFATKYEKICLELENEKTEIEAEYELKNNVE